MTDTITVVLVIDEGSEDGDLHVTTDRVPTATADAMDQHLIHAPPNNDGVSVVLTHPRLGTTTRLVARLDRRVAPTVVQELRAMLRPGSPKPETG
jgi:hypothetical protein